LSSACLPDSEWPAPFSPRHRPFSYRGGCPLHITITFPNAGSFISYPHPNPGPPPLWPPAFCTLIVGIFPVSLPLFFAFLSFSSCDHFSWAFLDCPPPLPNIKFDVVFDRLFDPTIYALLLMPPHWSLNRLKNLDSFSSYTLPNSQLFSLSRRRFFA